jgi:phosphoesterase RecJ-like protein
MLFEEHRLAYLRFVGAVLGRAELVAGKSFIWASVTEADLAEYDVTLEETEGLIDFLRQTKEAEVSCVLKEAEGDIRVSLRSVGHVDVSAVATLFGGGGHRYAAGFTTTDPVPRVVETILQAL